MKIRHQDLLPDEKQPFLHCKLGREEYATVLTTIVQNYADGFVLALNGEWGTGKTTFVKMWQGSLEKAKYKTIYFNAWENDIENEPLIGLLGELKKLSKNKINSTFKSLLKKGAIITKNILPALTKGVISKYVDAGTTLDVLENAINAASEILSDEVDEYLSKQKGLIEFKNELTTYIKANNDGKAVVFIIDELDRCRPDYAVEVLEKIKHFFSVKGIVFVLSIDKIQLGHSIKGYYGCQNINTEEYLRRFIDLEYKLPAPDANRFCKYLFDYYGFQAFFKSEARIKITELREDGNIFIKFTTNLFENQKYTLRQQEKLFAQARLILRTFAPNQYIFPTLLFMLIHIKNFESDFYNDIKNHSLKIQQLVDKIETIFKVELLTNQDDDQVKHFCIGESLFIKLYHNFKENKYFPENNLFINTRDTQVLTFKTKTIEHRDNNLIFRYLIHYDNSNFENLKIDYLTKKIDLFENIS